jgi:hypothetical protein
LSFDGIKVWNGGMFAFFSAFFVFFAIFLVSSIILYIFASHLVLHRRIQLENARVGAKTGMQ